MPFLTGLQKLTSPGQGPRTPSYHLEMLLVFDISLFGNQPGAERTFNIDVAILQAHSVHCIGKLLGFREHGDSRR